MGKPKKGKKGRHDDDFGDDDVDIDPLAQVEPEEVVPAKPATSKSKKGKKKKTDDWQDDVDAELAEMSLEQGQEKTGMDNDMNGEIDEVIPQPKMKKKDKKKSKRKEESDEDDAMDADDILLARSKPLASQPVSAFSVLGNDDDSVEDVSSEEQEEVIKEPIKKDNKKQKSFNENQENESDKKTQQKKKGKKDKKKKKDDEEDIDALLAEIEQKTVPDKGIEFKDMSSMTQEEIAKALEAEYDEEDDDKKKKKKNKKSGKDQEKENADEEADNNEDDGDEDVEDEGSTVKSAAQKKKEKKERQKQKKMEEKAKLKNKKNKVETEEDNTDKMDVEASAEKSVAPPDGSNKETITASLSVEGEEKPTDDKEDDAEDDKKKKKKDRRKKKGEKEEEKETKKKPSKMAKLIQEQQKKIQEEEERIRKEMEEKERKIEEARKLKEETERKAKEKKEREKQKKKDKIEKQKKEGTFLTAKQKEAQKRAQQMLEAMKAQGYEVAGEEAPKKKRPVYEKKKKKPQHQDSIENKEPEPMTPEEEKTPIIENVPEAAIKKEDTDDVKDAWDASDEDVKDEWDAESEKEEESQTEVPEKKARVSESSSRNNDKDASEEDESEEESIEEESDEDESSEESSSEDDMTAAEKARNKAVNRIQKRKADAEKKKSTDVLRAAVVVVLGHVDTGKTKILDKLRRTNVQDNEAGGITQQIGATNVPVQAIKDSTKMCKEFSKNELKLPGLLIIDTPGHESFGNLRSRGSSLCDIAILVVDIMHGLEPQTIESINLLKERKCPFVVALNKIDRLYGWQPNPHSDVVNVIKKQKTNTKLEFEERVQQVIVQLAEQSLNAKLFYENKNPKEYISLVPTSAHSGDGMGNLVALICELSQTHLAKKLAYSEELHATVMEVKALPGLGTTIDVILVNGKINESDTIIVPGTEGPIVTQVRGLLMPQPMKELRVKNAYEHHKEVKAAQGVKIIAKDLDHSLAGLPVYIAHYADEIDIYKEDLKEALEDILSSIKLQEKGVYVQASTLGSLEALLQFLKDSKIPYAGINIGPVHKRDIMKVSVMLDRDPQYAVLLAFDVKVEREAQELADSLGIRIFTAEIIYHLFDSFMAYRDEYRKSKQEEFKHIAVFPCKLRVLPQCIFNSRDPIVMGVTIEAGFVKMGTPICVPSKENIVLGHITSLEVNHKQIDKATKGQEVCIKIENLPGDTPKLYGRHFDHTDMLVSKISRESIDAVKNYFRDEMSKNDWQVILELKKMFQIL